MNASLPESYHRLFIRPVCVSVQTLGTSCNSDMF